MLLATEALPSLDVARDGSYEAWVLDAAGRAYSAGHFQPGTAVRLESPIAGGVGFAITVEPPADGDPAPSAQRVLEGSFRGGRALLAVAGALTQGTLALREHPGTFTMFTTSNNDTDGYPSNEEAGIWLFNMRPRDTPQNDMWVRLTQLEAGWTYEGWMVRDIEAPGAIWLSYGKFEPDETGAVNAKDDTGWGPFSGVIEFRSGGVDNFPGNDWIANPFGYSFPAALSLPLDLREKTLDGRGRWTHVITIEPATDRGEPIGSERPFFIRPYRDSFGDAGPGIPREITYYAESIPRGQVEVR
jgi:hypothetical protein